MPIRTPQARELCTKNELDLYLASLARAVKKHTPARLSSKVTRTRNLREKYRDLAAAQRREARGKQEPRRSRTAKGNVRTARKAQLFDEVLRRYETRLAQVSKPEKRAVGKKSAASKSTARKPAPKKKVTATRKTTKRTPGAEKSVAQEKPVARKASRHATSQTASPAKLRGVAADTDSPQRRPQPSDLNVEQAAKQSRFRRGGRKRIQQHVAAQGRRRQARRDTR